jgi:hypothetical protein
LRLLASCKRLPAPATAFNLDAVAWRRLLAPIALVPNLDTVRALSKSSCFAGCSSSRVMLFSSARAAG